MGKIDLRKDAKKFRRELNKTVKSLAKSTEPISALEFGYDCDQGGWIFIHADRRPQHDRDGQWTVDLDDDNTIEMPHWIEAIDANFEGEEIQLTKFDGTKLVIPGFDSEDAPHDEEEDGGPIVVAIGEMIHDVVMSAKTEGLFADLGKPGTIQLDIEDFNGGWGWPEYDDLGKTNLA